MCQWYFGIKLTIKIRTDAVELTNVRIAGFGQFGYLVRKSEMFVKDETSVASRGSGAEGTVLCAECMAATRLSQARSVLPI